MTLKKLIFLLFLGILISFFIYKNLKLKDEIKVEKEENLSSYYSNIIKDINYTTVDLKGNEYIINASEGEIDLKNNEIIYLKNVTGFIKLKNSDSVNIKSDYGKYDMSNIDTIFSKNVVITYQDSKIISDNLDYSMARGTMIITKDVVFTNKENILHADMIEINTITKDTKILMYDINKKVKIKNY